MSSWNCGSLTPNGTRLANSSQVRQLPAAVRPAMRPIRPRTTTSTAAGAGRSPPVGLQALLARARPGGSAAAAGRRADVDADHGHHENGRDREQRPLRAVRGAEDRWCSGQNGTTGSRSRCPGHRDQHDEHDQRRQGREYAAWPSGSTTAACRAAGHGQRDRKATPSPYVILRVSGSGQYCGRGR